MAREHKVLVSQDIHTPDGLAYDWIHGNLYWTDTGKDRIDVMGLGDASNWRRTLVDTGLDEPRAIVVDPREKHRLVTFIFPCIIQIFYHVDGSCSFLEIVSRHFYNT